MKRIYIDFNSLILWCGPDTKNEKGFSQLHKPSLGIVVDHPWCKDHRLYGCPIRINLHLWRWFVMIGQKSQVWNRKEGTIDSWRWITWHPDHQSMGCRTLKLGTKFGTTKEWECSRLKGHKGDHV